MSGLQRWAPLSGIFFAVLLVGGILLLNTPSGDEIGRWETHYEDSGNRTRAVISGLLIMLSGLAFLVFTWRAAAVVRAGGGNAEGASLASLSGLGSSVVIVLGGAILAQAPAAVEFTDAPLPSAQVLSLLDGLGSVLAVGFASWFAAVFIAATLLSAEGTGLTPSWLRWTGYATAVILITAPFLFITAIVLPLWVLATGIYGLTRTRA
jgi:hypothetical protein